VQDAARHRNHHVGAVLELTEWFRRHGLPDRPWLLVGKGPTFDRRGQFDLEGYNVLGLNHVASRQRVDVAHVIDVDVIGDCPEAFLHNAQWLIMPRRPHLRSELPSRRLEDWFASHPVLGELDRQDRLIWYNLREGSPVGRSPLIGCMGGFSSEAALRILGLMGIRRVRTLGIDGGRTYGEAFEHLKDSTLLANGAASFDLQFHRLELVSSEYEMEVRPLVDPLRIYVGTDESELVPFRVLEYSIRKATRLPVEVTPMVHLAHPVPARPSNRPRTQFSFYRFMVPALAGRHGRALYLDSDMLVLRDIAELADLPFDGHTVLCTPPAHASGWTELGGSALPPRLAVMLLDCGSLSWDIEAIVEDLDAGRYTYADLFDDLCIVPRDLVAETIPAEWNHLEQYDPGSTKLLHYTVVPTQPWKSDANPLQAVWMSYYEEAVEAGAVPPEEVEASVRNGNAKPSLQRLLRFAPGRRSPMTSASLDLLAAQTRISELEAKIEWSERTIDWRIGHLIGRCLRAPTKLAKLTRPASRA